MTNLPFLLRVAQSSGAPEMLELHDLPTSEDPLPSILEIDGSGYVVERLSTKTAVGNETSDDK